MSSRCRKPLLFGFTTAAALLAVVSTAFACTVFLGTMTATLGAPVLPSPPGPPASNGSVSAVGSGTGMTHCLDTSTQTGQIPPAGQTVTVTVNTVAGCGTGGPLPAGQYTINWASSGAQDCMVPGGTGTPIGTITVPGSPQNVIVPGASRAGTVPLGPGTLALCITSATGSVGNQLTLTGTYV